MPMSRVTNKIVLARKILENYLGEEVDVEMVTPLLEKRLRKSGPIFSNGGGES